LRYFKIKPQQVLVLHDELDLKPGFARLKQAGGDGGHNGLKSLSLHIQSKDFWRLRIGIGRPESRDQVSNYVLGIPGLGDILKLKQSISLVANNFKHLKNGDEQAFMRSVHGEES
jgi:PTH1 family peptidyl-tRNA hydrolase